VTVPVSDRPARGARLPTTGRLAMLLWMAEKQFADEAVFGRPFSTFAVPGPSSLASGVGTNCALPHRGGVTFLQRPAAPGIYARPFWPVALLVTCCVPLLARKQCCRANPSLFGDYWQTTASSSDSPRLTTEERHRYFPAAETGYASDG